MKKAPLLISLLNNERGVAMIIAIFAMVLTVVIATEVSYETQVEYVSSSQAVNRVKAYYAAKSGVELSLFRILLYKKAMAQFGEQLKDNKSMLDPIWQFPFTWPPMAIDDMSEADKDTLQDVAKESFMDTQYAVTIESEGGKIDINDLGSENKAVADAMQKQILQIFDLEIENNETFADKYENFDFEELANDIRDYIDEDKESLNGRGDESLRYKQPEDTKNFKLPPNRPFMTLEELHMVRGMQDAFYDLLKSRITVYGTKGINVNYASEDVLKALDPQIKETVLTALLQRRSDPKQGGPFKSEDEFYDFLESKGMRTQNLRQSKLPLLFDAEYNFRIISGGVFKNVRRQITAVTFDLDNLTPRFVEILDKTDEENKKAAGDNPPAPNNNSGTDPKKPNDSGKKTTVKTPKGRPTVVFWQES